MGDPSEQLPQNLRLADAQVSNDLVLRESKRSLGPGE